MSTSSQSFDNHSLDLQNFSRKAVVEWKSTDVRDWLNSCGFSDWSQHIAIKHRVNGQTLLLLHEEDLRLPPLSMNCLGDIKRLNEEISKLKSNCQNGTNIKYVQSIVTTTNGIYGNGMYSHNERLIEENKLNGSIRKSFMSSDELIRRVESPDTKEKSLLKLVLAFMYCSISLLITSFIMVLVHDRVPNMKMYPPLPDIVLDNIPLIPWAFECCEVIGLIMMFFWVAVLIFHKHRIVIMRRMFSITGTIFLLRCVTMLITSLSVPGIHLECRAVSYGNLSSKLKQAFHIWSHLGMSIQGVRTCGDYMFSGHTATITLLNHFITEYTPDEWRGLHTITWIMNVFGIFFILAGHEHYSIDVFIAFYITSRLFLSYHANAYNYANMTSIDSRVRVWFPLGWLFESGGVGRIENVFELPILFKSGRNDSVNGISKKSSIFDIFNNKNTNNNEYFSLKFCQTSRTASFIQRDESKSCERYNKANGGVKKRKSKKL